MLPDYCASTQTRCTTLASGDFPHERWDGTIRIPCEALRMTYVATPEVLANQRPSRAHQLSPRVETGARGRRKLSRRPTPVVRRRWVEARAHDLAGDDGRDELSLAGGMSFLSDSR